MANAGKETKLILPADGEYALLVRLVIGGLGLLAELDVDEIDDLRTATNECCDCLLHQPIKPISIELTAVVAKGCLRCRFFAARGDERSDEPAQEIAVTRGILETLLPSVELESDERGLYGISFATALCGTEDV